MLDFPTRYIAIAVLVLLAFVGLYAKGRLDGGGKIKQEVEDERAKWQVQIATNQSSFDKKAMDAAADFSKKIDSYRTEINKLKTKTRGKRIKAVDVYIPTSTDAFVTNGFVDLHNTAALGQPLNDTPASNAEERSDFQLSDVGSVVAQNYYQCNINTAQLEALQSVIIKFQDKQKGLIK